MIIARLSAISFVWFLMVSMAFGQAAHIALTGDQHVANVDGFVVDGQKALVMGNDKVIRLIDFQTQTIVQSFRFERGEGKVGSLTAIATGPNFEKFAVGTFGLPGVSEPYIYVVDVEDNRIVYALRGHREDVTGLRFLGNGSTLLSTSNDKTLSIWDLNNGQRVGLVQIPERGIQILEIPNGRVVVALGNGQLCLVDIAAQKVVRKIDAHRASIRGIVLVGNTVCSGDADGHLHTWTLDLDKSGTFRFEVEGTPKPITGLSLSKDQTAIVYSLGRTEEFSVDAIQQSRSLQCGLFDPMTRRTIKSIDGHDKPVRNVCQASDGNFFGINEDADFLKWSEDGRFQQIVFRKAIRPKHGVRFSHAGPSDTVVQWSSDYTIKMEDTLYNHAFDAAVMQETKAVSILPLEPKPLGISVRWNSNPAKVKQAWMEQNKGVALEDGALPEYVFVLKNEQILSSFFLHPFSKFGKFAHGIALDSERTLISCAGGLFVFNRQGQLLRELTDQNSFARYLSVPRTNQNTFFSYGMDGIFRFWNRKTEALLFSLVVAENEWVAWTKDGYYDCSPGAERLVGWQVNNGHDQLADFQPLEYFHSKFHKPAVLRSLLQTKDVGRSLSGTGTNADSATENLGPKISLRLDSKPKYKNGYFLIRNPEVELVIDVQAKPGSVLKELNLRAFDRHLETLGPSFEGKTSAKFKHTLKLTPGNQIITVQALSSNLSFSTSAPLNLSYKTSSLQSPAKKLYVLGIGISDYGSSRSFQRLPMPVNQTKEVVEVLSKGGAQLFSEGVEARAIIPKNRDEVFEALAQIKNKFEQTDMLVIYWAGHGVEKNGNFYFAFPDTETDTLRQRGISASVLSDELSEFKGGKICMIIDTCHAGQAMQTLSAQVRSNGRSDGAGVMTFASAQSMEEAQDGLFGEVLIQGLKGTRKTTIEDPDLNQKRVVISKLLVDFVREQVNVRSDSAQQPVSNGFAGDQLKLAIATGDVR